MVTITGLTKVVQGLFGETAARLGRETGFIKRERVLNGSSYAQTLVFGWLSNPQSTMSELSQMAGSIGKRISKQGLQERFGESSAQFMRAVMEAGFSQLLEATPGGMGLMKRFEYVHVLDSTTVCLPDELAQLWAGCGGDGGKAALKITVDWELRRGGLRSELSAGRQHDQSATLAQATPAPGSLRLTDVGYFNLERLAQLDAQGSYWIIRLKSQTKLYHLDGQAFDWISYLQTTQLDQVCQDVLVGAKRLKARLCATRLSPRAVERRQTQLRHTAHKKQQPISARSWLLTQWAVCITNVPVELLAFEEVMVFLRLRWQIELLFKLWKSQGLLDEWRSTNPWRILTEVYAKLLALLLQHWLVLLALWQLPQRSLVLAAHLIQKFALSLAIALSHPSFFTFVLARLQFVLPSCTMSSLRALPHTYQLLQAFP
jgi:hypothetical protein